MLHAIRENLAKSASSDAAQHAPPCGRSVPPTPNPLDVVARFTEQLAAVGAQWTVVRGATEAAHALARILTSAGARRGVGSDAPPVQRLRARLGGGFGRGSPRGLSRDSPFACEGGVTT